MVSWEFVFVTEKYYVYREFNQQHLFDYRNYHDRLVR
jgi:hypothetical protein